MTVMILAGLQSVDSSLLEAACIDGGNPFQRFLAHCAPSIRPVLFTSVWLAITQNFQQFTIINNMTGGGLVDATTTLSIAAYKAAFQSYNFGESAAIGVIWMVFLFCADVHQQQGKREPRRYPVRRCRKMRRSAKNFRCAEIRGAAADDHPFAVPDLLDGDLLPDADPLPDRSAPTLFQWISRWTTTSESPRRQNMWPISATASSLRSEPC
ncbi:MAG: carbohydrate ABC transporter permease [Oscillospiraceae bacterium]